MNDSVTVSAQFILRFPWSGLVLIYFLWPFIIVFMKRDFAVKSEQVFVQNYLFASNKVQPQGAKELPASEGWWGIHSTDGLIFACHESAHPDEVIQRMTYLKDDTGVKVVWANGFEPAYLNDSNSPEDVKVFSYNTVGLVIRRASLSHSEVARKLNRIVDIIR